MEISKWIRVDRPVNISPDLDKENWYPARVLKILPKSFLISIPVRQSVALRLQKGWKIRLNVTSDSGAFLSTCEVLDVVAGEEPYLEIEIPQEIVHMERRRFARYPTRIEVYYSEIHIRVNQVYFEKSYSVDISGGGMRLEMHRNCPQETLLRLKFTLPVGRRREEFLLTGRIVRSIPSPEGGKNHAGIEFIGVSSGVQESISRFVASKIKSR